MPVYEVQPGDSPASIAARDDMAGCMKCSRDLVHANPHKPTRTLPNGFTTFETLHVGEKLNLPEKWFNGDLDRRPPAYFAALPHPDGITPSTLGDASAGVLADYATLDAAAARVGALATMSDQPFSDAVNGTADAIDASVQEVSGAGSPAIYAAPYAQDTRKSTGQARKRNIDLETAIKAGDQTASFQARTDILKDFSSALLSAGLALQAFHGDPQATQPAPGGAFPAAVMTAAQTAATAIAADPNYCAMVAHPGSVVNSAVHAFKIAWNAAGVGPQLPINTGNYEQATAEVLAEVLGGAPLPCTAPAASFTTPSAPVTSTPATGLSTGEVVGIGLLGAGVVGGVIYFTTRKPTRGRR
jgi:hypothetical protein